MLKQWRYRLEKGRPHLLLLIALLVLIVGISVIGGFIVFVTGAGDGLGGSMWWAFLHITDPGYLGDAEKPLTAVFGTIFTVLGMITFMAGLVGILTSLITSGLKNLHEGGAAVAFENHIVIVGWNSRLFTLVADLLHASTDNQIAILGPLDKELAETQLERRVFDPIARDSNARAARKARGCVVYRQGNPGVDHDLNRVSARKADRFVLLSQQTGVSERAIDVAQIRTLYSIERVNGARDTTDKRFNTVVEFASEHFRSHAFYAVRINPRLDAWVSYYEEQLAKRKERSFLPKPRELKSTNDMTAVNPDQIVSRVLVQCAVQPYMSGVYDELFSFQGKEMFLWRPPAHWHKTWEAMLALPAADRPLHLGHAMGEGIVIGSFQDNSFSFSPGDWTSLHETNTQYLVMGDKQAFSDNAPKTGATTARAGQCAVQIPPPKDEFRVLVLGVNRRFPLIMEQFADYAEQYPDTRLTIDVLEQCEQPQLPSYPENVALNLHHCDCTSWAALGKLLEDEQPYDTVISLAEDLDIDNPEVDARVTLVLVMLRAFRDDPHWQNRLQHASIVAEVRDPRNRDILNQERLAGDVIVGDGYVSGFVAQVCMDHRLEELYREVLDFGQYEIYAREISPQHGTCSFGDLVQRCAEQEETAIGILQHQKTERLKPLLAPGFEQEVGALDRVLVIAPR